MINELNWRQALPATFPPEARVWIYQGARPFSAAELAAVRKDLSLFCHEWISHNRPVRGWADVLFDRFVVMMADDTGDRLCGSAVDHSVRVVKDLENRYGVGLMDRTALGFFREGEILVRPLAGVQAALRAGEITPDTLFFNHAVATKAAFEAGWLLPVKDSWLGARFLPKISA